MPLYGIGIYFHQKIVYNSNVMVNQTGKKMTRPTRANIGKTVRIIDPGNLWGEFPKLLVGRMGKILHVRGRGYIVDIEGAGVYPGIPRTMFEIIKKD